MDHQDKDGMTPLLVAAFEGHRDVCDLLLEYDADMDHCDVTGRTPLWAAASMGHGSVVKLLLYWGCCVDTIDNEGRTVLSVAAAQGGTDVVKQLLARGTRRWIQTVQLLHFPAVRACNDFLLAVKVWMNNIETTLAGLRCTTRRSRATWMCARRYWRPAPRSTRRTTMARARLCSRLRKGTQRWWRDC